MSAEPTYATPITPGARHDLKKIDIMARVLGVPLMPWQRLVARVASERHPDDPKRFRYHTVILTVPRQSGKTTLMRAILAQRALVNRNRSAFYTAQTGKDATARWKDLIKQIESSVLAPFVQTKLAQGSQSMAFPNGSSIAPFAPTPKSLHGYTPDDVMLDEIFEWTTEQGESLMGAVKPAQQTRVNRQLWLVSTMGTQDSEFLNSWIETGRAAAGDPNSGICYFEWSLAEGLDSYAPENWGFHPALGHTITADTLQEATGSHSVGEWERAYMNRRTKVATKWIPDETIEAITGAVSAPGDMSKVHLVFDVDPKPGGGGAFVAAWRADDGKIHAKAYLADRGRSWVAQAARDALTMKPARMTYDDTAINRHAAGDVASDQIEATKTADFTTGCMMLLEMIETGGLVIEDTENGAIREALQGVVTRPLGEGWAISRSRSTIDVSLAVAMAGAVKSAAHVAPMAAPRIRF